MRWLLLWVFISGVSAQNFSSIALNAICKDEPAAWRCEILSPDMKEAIESDHKYVQGIEGREPMLCFHSSRPQITQPLPASVTTPTTQIQGTTRSTTQTRVTTRPNNQTQAITGSTTQARATTRSTTETQATTGSTTQTRATTMPTTQTQATTGSTTQTRATTESTTQPRATTRPTTQTRETTRPTTQTQATTGSTTQTRATTGSTTQTRATTESTTQPRATTRPTTQTRETTRPTTQTQATTGSTTQTRATTMPTTQTQATTGSTTQTRATTESTTQPRATTRPTTQTRETTRPTTQTQATTGSTTQTRATTGSTTQTRATTKSSTQTQATTWSTTSKPSFWWLSVFNEIPEETDTGVSSWTTQKTFEIESAETKTSHKSEADKMCEIYSQYVYRIVHSPALIGNQETLKISECGIPRFVDAGGRARPREFPHMALIGYGRKPWTEWLCGGSLISPKYVLSTAAYTRFETYRLAEWVRLGDLDISTDNDAAEPVNVRIINRARHPLYKNNVLYHDIALYELESEVKLGRYIRPICLQTTKEFNSDTALASGWGITSWDDITGGGLSGALHKVNVTLVNHETCSKSYNVDETLPSGIDDDLMLCAGGTGRDTCLGDNGGPLQIPHKKFYCMYSQIGVISFGKECGKGHPGVYTRISHYLPWIESVVWP